MSLRLLLCIFAGGGLGACLRWVLGLWCASLFPVFNVGVILANAVGCFSAGLAGAWFEKRIGLPVEVRHFLITGLLGGFTTFSSFSLEAIGLFSSSYAHGGLYLAGTVVLCICAALCGYYLMIRYYAVP